MMPTPATPHMVEVVTVTRKLVEADFAARGRHGPWSLNRRQSPSRSA